MKGINKYILFARLLPAFITVMPATLVYFFLTLKYSNYSISEYLQSQTFIVGVSATFALSYLISMVVRELGAFLERRYFMDKLGFPTTYLMLREDNRIPDQTKRAFRDRVLADYQLDLSRAIQGQGRPNEAIGLLTQASRILSTKYQQHQQVKDANIAYGFSRNVSGGLFISLPCAIVGILVGLWLHIPQLTFWSACATLILAPIAAFHKKWIINNAERYAHKLIAVYLSGQ